MLKFSKFPDFSKQGPATRKFTGKHLTVEPKEDGSLEVTIHQPPAKS